MPVTTASVLLHSICGLSARTRFVVDSSWNVIAHGDAREEKWRGNKRMEWVTSKHHMTAEHRLARAVQTLQADVHSSPASSRLNWRPRPFKWTRPFCRKTKSDFCACAITFHTQSTFHFLIPGLPNVRHAAVTAVPVFLFLLPDQRLHVVQNVCIYTHICDCVQTAYELPLLPNNTAVKHFHTNRSGAKCWQDIYRWGAGLEVTGPIRDIGQNVLQPSYETGSGSSDTVTDTFCCLSLSSRRSSLKIQ
jgi:hypothetical protein